MIQSRARQRHQIGALPYFLGPDGQVQVVLVTTRETQRWSIPKGNPMKGKKPHKAAAIEAYEEAGVRGRIGRKAIGSYSYCKQFKSGEGEAIVAVYPLRIRKFAEKFPEMGERKVATFPIDTAARMIAFPELATLLTSFTPD